MQAMSYQSKSHLPLPPAEKAEVEANATATTHRRLADTRTVDEKLGAVVRYVSDGDFAMADATFLNLRNHATLQKRDGNKNEHDQIYHRLLELAILFQLTNVNGNGCRAALAIFTALEQSPLYNDPLNHEASLRKRMFHSVDDLTIDAISILVKAAQTEDRPCATYSLWKLVQDGFIQQDIALRVWNMTANCADSLTGNMSAEVR